MLRTETVEPGTLECLNDLMQDENLNDFFLVGGTALSLQIGHRMSIDLDLFSQSPFDIGEVFEYLETAKNFRANFQAKNTLKGEIKTIQVDLITHAYPLVKPLIIIDGIRLASLEDIAAMKLNAIVRSGSRLKDFIDIAYLSCHLSLNQMMTAYEQKYSNINPFIALKALARTEDADEKEPIDLIKDTYKFKEIKQRLDEMPKNKDKVFELSPCGLTKEQNQTIAKKPQLKRGRGI